MNNKLNLEIGTKFGKWKIVSNRTKKISNITNWTCKCECGHEQFVPLNNLMNGSSTQCEFCSKKESGKKRRKGHKLISGDMWSQIKRKAEKKGIFFDLRIEEAWEQYVHQNGRCITNQKIYLSGYPYDKDKTTAVLVLSKPEDGFIKDNIMWVDTNIAKMKGDFTYGSLIMMVSSIYHSNCESNIVDLWESSDEWWNEKTID